MDVGAKESRCFRGGSGVSLRRDSPARTGFSPSGGGSKPSRRLRPRTIFSALSVALLISVFSGSSVEAQTASIVTDTSCATVARHGLNKLTEALQAKGFRIENVGSPEEAQGRVIIVAGLVSKSGAAANQLLNEASKAVPDAPEALAVRHSKWKGRELLVLCGSDDRGLMYAALDVADRIGWSAGAKNPLAYVRDVAEKPDLLDRSISIYTMNRRYFESRLYDEAYWESYFDTLARNRFNSFLVIFGYENGGFMAPPYPYFFDVEGFPDIRLVGLTPEGQRKNLEAFKRMIQIAHERGLRFVPGIWDHIYRGGVQGGGIPGADRPPDRPTPGLVWGVNADNLYAYSQAAIKKFIEVFPEIDGIQFRMHDESGLKNEEIVGFWHEIFSMTKKARPDLPLDLRAKGLRDEVIDDGLAQGIKLRVTTKFWMEQMGLPFHPTHVNPQDQMNRRHGYADLLRYPQKYRVHWRLWTGGTSRILLWGDPDYAKTFVRSAHLYDGNSFEVNEPLATKMLGQPHDMDPFELLTPEYKYYRWEFERYWHFFEVFGRLAYNPETPAEVWDREFIRRFGPEAAPFVEKGLHIASRVLPRIVASVYPYSYFPTTYGWPEKMRMRDLPRFAAAQGSDTEQFASFDEEAENIVAGKDTAKRRPIETSRWFGLISQEIQAQATEAGRRISDKKNKEFLSTRTDLEILANLALYYSRRIPAAVSYALFKKTQDLNALDDAIAQEKRAVEAWERLVAAAGDVYASDLMMGVRRNDLSGHWRDELKALKEGLVKLDQERAAFRPLSTKGKPSIAHVPVRKISTGEPLVVKATVASVGPLKDVRMTVFQPDGTRRVLEMEKRGDSRYEALTALPQGVEKIAYFIEAEDVSGALTAFPPKGEAGRIHVTVSSDITPPEIRHVPVVKGRVGEALRVTAEAKDTSGVRYVRLRYRHLTQFEDYQTAEMALDPRTGRYTAEIPADFVVPKWDLIYFIEAMDSRGNGRIYPDLEDDIPYIVVKLER